MLTEQRANELFDFLSTVTTYDKITLFEMVQKASEMETESEQVFFLTEMIFRFITSGCSPYDFEDEFRKFEPWKKICVRHKLYLFTPDWKLTKQMNFRRNPVWIYWVKK